MKIPNYFQTIHTIPILGVHHNTLSTTKLTSSDANTLSPTKDKNELQRLDLYNSLFGQDARTTCQQTGLLLTPSLNYSLYTFLHLYDISWVLAIISIDELNQLNEKYGKQDAKTRKIHQIGTVIKNFCANDPRKLKGFKCNDLIIVNHHNDDDNGIYNIEDIDGELQNDLFAILMYCHPQLSKSEKYIKKLMKKIKLLTNETVSVGVAKLNEWETFDEWKHRAFRNMINARNIVQSEKDTFYSDIDVNYKNPTHWGWGPVTTSGKMGNKEEFDKKLKEIANKEDYEWIAAIMEVDDFESFVFLNSKEIVNKETDKIKKEIYILFDIYGNEINKNEMKYFDIN